MYNLSNDEELAILIAAETKRQQEVLTLIPSENYTSLAVREAVGSVLSNKYSEGYAGKRYYEGNEVIDRIELLAIERAKQLFGVPYANVQPYSGSPANSEILFALAEPGSTIMGLKLSSGGHLTHGHPRVSFSGKFYNSVQFGLTPEARIDYEQMRTLANEHRPRVIILGTTAYPFLIDWKLAREITDECGAYLIADISHEVGLVISGVTPTPVPFAHVVMSTTHKTLRGPRGAMILVTDDGLKKDASLAKKIDAAVMPGMQGGPHNNTTAGIAVALREASTLEFKEYGKQIIINAKTLASELTNYGIRMVGGGTENHLMIMDFSGDSEGKGTLVSIALNAAGIVTNRNTVPGDTTPFYPSGVRLGTPAVTTRGMKEAEMGKIAEWIAEIVEIVKDTRLPGEKNERASHIALFKTKVYTSQSISNIRCLVRELCNNFPVLGSK